MSEVSIASARASVMVYDEPSKKWLPSGSSSGLSKVHIYHHAHHNTFRVVGRKLHDQEVVINCSILKGLKYNQATPTFHQWRDNRQVYGLNFSSKDDAEAFAFAMMHSVECLNSGQVVQVVQQQQQLQRDEDMGYRTMTREDIAVIQERRMSQQIQQGQQQAPPAPVVLHSPCSTPSTLNPTHHRTSSAPQPPPPPSMPNIHSIANNTNHTTTSSHLNNTSLHSANNNCPPPPPPPMPNLLTRTADSDTSLASALANAQLKKSRMSQQPDAVSTTSTSSSSSSGSNSSGIYGTLKKVEQNGQQQQQSGGSLMDEMAKTLARRRAMCNRENGSPAAAAATNDEVDSSATSPPTINSTSTLPKPASPKLQRKRTGSDASNAIVLNGTNNNYNESELEGLKQEILKEVRKELSKMKMEIIDAIKIELNRR